MMKPLLPCILAWASTLCWGADDADLALAHALMRPGYDLAGLQAALFEKSGQANSGGVEELPLHMLVRDINGDGRKDVFMAVEENPEITDRQGRPCARPDREKGCTPRWGERSIEVHYQQPDGSYRLGVRSQLMMDKDGGGMDPDPFKGFEVTPKGAIKIFFSGGAGWKWEYVYTVQFRQDDIYVIDVYDYLCNGVRGDVQCHEAEVNLLNGRWWLTTWVGDAEDWNKTEGKREIGQLYRLEEAYPEMDL